MNQSNIFTPQADRDLERRRALAKVYALLIRLAEEKEAKEKAADNVASESEEKTPDDAPASQEKESPDTEEE